MIIEDGYTPPNYHFDMYYCLSNMSIHAIGPYIKFNFIIKNLFLKPIK